MISECLATPLNTIGLGDVVGNEPLIHTKRKKTKKSLQEFIGELKKSKTHQL